MVKRTKKTTYLYITDLTACIVLCTSASMHQLMLVRNTYSHQLRLSVQQVHQDNQMHDAELCRLFQTKLLRMARIRQ